MEAPPNFQGYNPNSQSVRRILREYKEMSQETSTLFRAVPLEDNIFEWHFTIRGPRETEFEGGVYHGRILLPAEYPYKPPDIVFLTPNGRFELDKKICLTISSHHEETWRPSWSIRTVLLALIAFLPTKGDGALASLDWPPEERKKLAKKSLGYKCEKCGVHNLTALPPEDENESVKLSEVPDELQIRDPSANRPASSSAAPVPAPADPAAASSTLSTPQRPSLTQSAPATPIVPPAPSSQHASTSSSSSSLSSTSSVPQSPSPTPNITVSSSHLAASSAAILQTTPAAPVVQPSGNKPILFILDVIMALVVIAITILILRRVVIGFPGLQ
eukprot:TRINITY_DN5593_c0_g1_i1.p1 TRINITY_DN5593_c0_g1~~TRINITY_DN5593_c0_g1_i1.p1  ORF type:complete len:331 (-),score=58.67 TRINITY_DN5593_c0_g1_i1:90-1082(-)